MDFPRFYLDLALQKLTFWGLRRLIVLLANTFEKEPFELSLEQDRCLYAAIVHINGLFWCEAWLLDNVYGEHTNITFEARYRLMLSDEAVLRRKRL